MERYLLGVDSGSTATKAVIFDASGRTVAVGSRRVEQRQPRARHVERDMRQTWAAACGAIRDALGKIPADAIAAVGVTGHGDGLYLVDHAGAPLGPGILSLDSRAFDVSERWRQEGVLEKALTLTGQQPYPYAAVSLLKWIQLNEPQRYAKIGHVLFCKDWLRLCLTGTPATDPTEASSSFTDVNTQTYSDDVLALYGLTSIAHALPGVIASASAAGRITARAAAQTGLKAGTPVACGLHDVTSSALGMGNIEPGALSITAGTFSINEILSDRPQLDSRWSCRNGTRPGQWMNMSISPASSSNVDWALRELFQHETREAARLGCSLFDLIGDEVQAAFTEPASVMFHPFLFGSPFEQPASASFFGIRSWHRRAHLARAVIEGMVFNHRWHIEALTGAFPARRAGLTGGGSSSPLLAQLFADVLGIAIDIPESQEASALGAALCAGVSVGVFASLSDACARACRVARTYCPDAQRHTRLDEAYALWTRLIAAIQPLWPGLDHASVLH
ncbi:FGGY-family carbohydrate kinase [Paraburkholderia lycopersici]|uniref:L-xylulokinase n=1 Tax=Paraburkholderia lycopersici TaxID=416944 RepID=A0A1G6Q919_9BURK|nr:FGGY-family carbohydrate kinase [Paraburkholderia lycopersici]SDC88808.1 L-xylulokinase [Paraburkholderia lycopersici]